MAIAFSVASSRILANAAAVATAMAGGTTTAEARAIGLMLSAASTRNEAPQALIALRADDVDSRQLLPG